MGDTDKKNNTQAYFIKCKGVEAGTKQTKQELGKKKRKKRKGMSECWGWVWGDFFFSSFPSHSQRRLGQHL